MLRWEEARSRPCGGRRWEGTGELTERESKIAVLVYLPESGGVFALKLDRLAGAILSWKRAC